MTNERLDGIVLETVYEAVLDDGNFCSDCPHLRRWPGTRDEPELDDCEVPHQSDCPGVQHYLKP